MKALMKSTTKRNNYVIGLNIKTVNTGWGISQPVEKIPQPVATGLKNTHPFEPFPQPVEQIPQPVDQLVSTGWFFLYQCLPGEEFPQPVDEIHDPVDTGL